MLINLPDMNSSTKGWLLDYQFHEELKDEPIVARRWKFRSAHKIDAPISQEGKRKRVEMMVRPENLRNFPVD